MNEKQDAYCATSSITDFERLRLAEPTREGIVKARLPALLDVLEVSCDMPETVTFQGDAVVLPGLATDICVYCVYDQTTRSHLLSAMRVLETSPAYAAVCEWNEKERTA